MKHISILAIILSLLIPPTIQARTLEYNHTVANNVFTENTFTKEEPKQLIAYSENLSIDLFTKTANATQNSAIAIVNFNTGAKLGMSPKIIEAKLKAMDEVITKFADKFSIESFEVVSRSRPDRSVFMDELGAVGKKQGAETVYDINLNAIKMDPPGLRLVKNYDGSLEMVVSDDDTACFLINGVKI